MTGTLTPLHEIYQRHAAEVFRYAFLLSGNRAEAEDITSETCRLVASAEHSRSSSRFCR